MRGNIIYSKYGVHFSRADLDIDQIGEDKKNLRISYWKFTKCTFTPAKVDLSPIKHCTRLYMFDCDLEEITAWPPKIQEIRLRHCKNLRRIPEDPAQYKHLKKFQTGAVNLETWDIDLSQSEGVKCVGILTGFRDEEADLSKIQRKKNVISIGFFNSHFLQKTVDFSEFENLEEIFIENCDLEHVIDWPPRLKKLTLDNCPNLLSIPLEANQYHFLTELDLRNINLPNWNIDLTEAFYLSEIHLTNLLAYNPLQTAADPSLPKPSFKIPKKWAYCVGLYKLFIKRMTDLDEIPVEFAYNPFIYIEIIDCQKIYHIDCLAEPLRECTHILYWPAGGTAYESDEAVFYEERKWCPEKTKYLEYIKSVIPKMPTKKLKERYGNVILNYSPKIKISDKYSLYL